VNSICLFLTQICGMALEDSRRYSTQVASATFMVHFMVLVYHF